MQISRLNSSVPSFGNAYIVKSGMREETAQAVEGFLPRASDASTGVGYDLYFALSSKDGHGGSYIGAFVDNCTDKPLTPEQLERKCTYLPFMQVEKFDRLKAQGKLAELAEMLTSVTEHVVRHGIRLPY